MFILYADKTRLTARAREPTTSGSANVYRAQFEFSPDWDDMELVADIRYQRLRPAGTGAR